MTAPQGQPVLHHTITITPPVPEISDSTERRATLTEIMENKTDNDIPFASIAITIPVGPDERDLTPKKLVGAIKPTYDLGKTWKHEVKEGIFTLKPRSKDGVFPKHTKFTITLDGIHMNNKPGTATVTVTENTPGGPNDVCLLVTKVAAGVHFGDFKPRLPLVEAGAQAELSWTAQIPPTMKYSAELHWDTDLEHHNPNVTQDHSWSGYLHRDTAFSLRATITDDNPVPVTTHPTLATFITISHPHLTTTHCTVHGTTHILRARENHTICMTRTSTEQSAPPITLTATTDGLLSLTLAKYTTVPTVRLRLYPPDTITVLYSTTITARPSTTAPRLTVPVPEGDSVTLEDRSQDQSLTYWLILDWQPLGTGSLIPPTLRPTPEASP